MTIDDDNNRDTAKILALHPEKLIIMIMSNAEKYYLLIKEE